MNTTAEAARWCRHVVQRFTIVGSVMMSKKLTELTDTLLERSFVASAQPDSLWPTIAVAVGFNLASIISVLSATFMMMPIMASFTVRSVAFAEPGGRRTSFTVTSVGFALL